jgi:hypothetical protein
MSDRRVNDNEQDPGHDVERLLNLLDVLDIDDDPEIDPGPVPTPARFAEVTAEILDALRGQPGRRHDPRPVPSAALDDRRRSVDHVPLLVVGGVALGLALFPGQLVLALLLFGLCPALLLVKWMFEGYSGPELQRACDVLDGRADSVRGLRRRLVRMAEELVDVGPTVEDQLRSALAPSEPDVIMLRIRSASVAMRNLADRLDGTTRTVREFAHGWLADPIESCVSYRHTSTASGPGLVRLDMADALVHVRRLAAALDEHSARRIPAVEAGREPFWQPADEAHAIVQEVTRARNMIEKELSRLERSFDPLHRVAATQAIRTRVVDRLPRAAAVVGMTAVASTLSRSRRTPARSVFLGKTLCGDIITLGLVGRAAIAMISAA